MRSIIARRLAAVLLLAPVGIAPADAACHWGWYCVSSSDCGFVPYCDSPTDTPPPFEGINRPPTSDAPVPPSATPRRPLPGFKPITAPPPGRPGGTIDPAAPPNVPPSRSDASGVDAGHGCTSKPTS